MADQLSLRGGTTTEHGSFTGANKEVTVDTTKKTLVVHDGATVGGHPIMRENGSNSALALASAAAPSLKFTGDPNTGIYSPGADQVSISTNGTERLRINATGQVAAVSLGTAAAPVVTFTGDPNTGIYSPGADQVAISTNGSGRLFVDSSGNVTVNTTDLTSFFDGRFRVESSAAVTSFRSTGVAGAIINSLWHQATSGNNQFISFGTEVSRATRGNIYYDRAANGLAVNGTTNLVLATGGTERMRLDSSGRLGLGTSSPSTNLDIVVGSGTATQKLGSSSVSGGSYLNLHGASASKTWFIGANYNFTGVLEFTQSTANGGTTPSSTPAMVLSAAGNVGIGTTSPGSRLEVNTSSSSGVQAFAIANDHTNNVLVTNHASGSFRWADFSLNHRDGSAVNTTPIRLVPRNADISLQTQTAHNIVFGTNATERARIDSSGRVLIGTSTAVTGANASISKLNVIGNSSNSAGNAVAVIGRGAAASTLSAGNDVGAIFFTDNGSNEFAAIACQADAATGVADAPGRLVFSTTADGASSPTERMRIQSNGDILINRTTAEASGSSLQVIGTPAASFEIGVNGNNVVEFRNSGGASVIGSISINVGGTATAFNTSSDYRLKENVVDLDGAIDRLKQLRVRRFNFIADPDTVVDGFIAHEAATVVPEAITGTKDAVDADGNPVYQGIDQSKLVPLLTAALQDAIAEITTLKDRVAALEAA